MTQKQRILNRLQTDEWLSLRAALHMKPPIYRLSERIRELEREGYKIEHRKVNGKSYSVYCLRPAAPISLPPAFPPKTEQSLFVTP
jgi:hypothetical protein